MQDYYSVLCGLMVTGHKLCQILRLCVHFIVGVIPGVRYMIYPMLQGLHQSTKLKHLRASQSCITIAWYPTLQLLKKMKQNTVIAVSDRS